MSEILSDDAVLRLPPMLFGRIRWNKSLGAPVGDAATGFRVLVEEHTVSQFRIGPGGPEVIPGTGIWLPTVTVPCWTAPDEGEMHVVAFNVPGVHLNGFPDGQYHVKCELTGNWEESPLRWAIGFRRIEPLGYYCALTKEQHIVSLSFEVVLEAWRWRS